MGYQEDRLRRIDIFEDTIQYCERIQGLVDAIFQTRRNTVLYKNPIEENRRMDCNRYELPCTISVSQSRVLEAAQRIHLQYRDCRIGILNVSSATNPGGGVIRGCNGQEESLCRCSTLYPCLNTTELLQEYYAHNKDGGNQLYADSYIFTPGIVCMKTDTIRAAYMEESEWFSVDVISCAFPNQGENIWDTENRLNEEGLAVEKELQKLLENRMTGMLQVAVDNDIDIFVLGVPGCGVSGYSPDAVEQMLEKALKKFRHSFKVVEFVVYNE